VSRQAQHSGKAFVFLVERPADMELVQTVENLVNSVNGIAFLIGAIASLVVYSECRKCIEEIEREEMMESFLSE
jgi:uncharacterized protein (UPF0297 family)